MQVTIHVCYSDILVPMQSWLTFLCMCVSVTGPNPMVSEGTLVTIPLVDKLQDNCWEAKIVDKKDSKIKLSVNSLPTAPIGQYKLTVATQTPSGNSTSSYTPENDIYMLFNPWCEGKH